MTPITKAQRWDKVEKFALPLFIFLPFFLLDDQLTSQHAHLTLKAILACFLGREFQCHLFTFG